MVIDLKTLASAIALVPLLLVANLSSAMEPGEKPMKNVDVYVDQQDNVLATRVTVKTDAQGRFEVKDLKPGMYRVVVQVPAVTEKEKKAAATEDVGHKGLRYIPRWGQTRTAYGDVKYVTVYMRETANAGASSMNERLVNGRTAGVFVNIYKIGEVLKGTVAGSSR